MNEFTNPERTKTMTVEKTDVNTVTTISEHARKELEKAGWLSNECPMPGVGNAVLDLCRALESSGVSSTEARAASCLFGKVSVLDSLPGSMTDSVQDMRGKNAFA